MPQVLSPIQEPPFQIYELITVAQGVISVRAIDAAAGASVPLTRAMFVDPATTVPAPDRTGAATAPFATVQAAIDALPTPAGGAVLLASAQYAAEVLAIDGKGVTLIGLVGPQNDLSQIAAVVDLSTSSLSSNREVGLVNLLIGAVDVLTETPSAMTVEGCTCTTIACAAITAKYSRIEAIEAAGVARLIGCHLISVFTLPDDSQIESSEFESGATLIGPGAVALDQYSLAKFLLIGGSLAGATLLRSDVPQAQSTRNADGSAPIAHTVAEAGHPPGLYNWTAYVSNEVAATTGTLTLTISYTDPDTGATTQARAALALTGTGHFSLNPIAIQSDGSAAITVAGVFAAITGGPPRVNVYDAINQVG